MFALQHRRRISIYENIFVFYMKEEEGEGARKLVAADYDGRRLLYTSILV